VDALGHPGSSFHIHVDAKVSLEPFQQVLAGRANVRLLSNRVDANWMGYSLVEATLRLLADAMVELEVVDSLSHETVRQTLKKTSLSPT